jgi:hypothetical protein
MLDGRTTVSSVRSEFDCWPRRAIGVAIILAALSCGGDEIRPGREGERCAAPLACEAGLDCRADADGTLRCRRPLAECDRCTATSECVSGLVCTAFNDGSMRCGSGTGATTCRLP